MATSTIVVEMNTTLPPDWKPWRSATPLGNRRPTKTDLADSLHSGLGREDVLPFPTDEQCAGTLRILIVGINPSPWTAAVNAPFARPGNRFWPSLATAGITPVKRHFILHGWGHEFCTL